MKTILVDAVNAFIIPGEGINRQMFDLLEKYPNKKIILTNADDSQIITFGLTDLPYELFTLKHNPDKINPSYFQLMLAHFALNAKDVIYFEHNLDAVKSAQSVGILTHHYDADKKDLVALKNFLDNNLK